jgi:hypothetical protein
MIMRTIQTRAIFAAEKILNGDFEAPAKALHKKLDITLDQRGNIMLGANKMIIVIGERDKNGVPP